MGRKLNHIELFAGCGGLNLGLAAAGFELLFANELSPMAATTFAYNFLAEDLEQIADTPGAEPRFTKWLKSEYPLTQLKARLRENPLPEENTPKRHKDLQGVHGKDLMGKLIVGSIVDLNRWLKANPQVITELKESLDNQEIDLVSGGPPCQSFSMAGMRDFSNARNRLPGEFAKFVQDLKPKFVLLENVTGILRPFDVDGEKKYAWIEVAAAFATAGYVPLCIHTNARFAGVAQNRPRFVMIGIRYEGVYESIKERLDKAEPGLFKKSETFYAKVKNKVAVGYGDIDCFNAEMGNPNFGGLLSPLLRSTEHTVKDAIHDLKRDTRRQAQPSEYVRLLESYFAKHLNLAHPFEKGKPQNDVLRDNGDKVRRRFRIYQVLQQFPEAVKPVLAILSGDSDSLPDEVADKLLTYEYLLPIEEGGWRKGKIEGETDDERRENLVSFLAAHHTRKHSQRALDPKAPAPAALSIPDDACHYNWDYADLRTLTVREIARIQSFPDEFVFRSKVTTGGRTRKFEVPQYTQVGNAVPPLLGKALGEVIMTLEDYYQQAKKRKVASKGSTTYRVLTAEV